LMPAAGEAGGRILVSGPLGSQAVDLPDNIFVLSWIHSVERTPWRETFAVAPSGEITLTVSEFESAGAGLPGMPNGKETVRLAGRTMRLTGSGLAVWDLQVQSSDLSHHRLRAGNRVFDLNAVFGEGIITIRAVPPQRRKQDETR